MNIDQLNEKLKELLNEGIASIQENLSEDKIIRGIENLKGKYFEGSLKNGHADVDTSEMPDEISADFVASFENFKKDNFSSKNFLEYIRFLKKLEPLIEEDFEFADWIHSDFSDEKDEDFINDFLTGSFKHWSFFSLSLNLELFDNDFKNLANKIDDYLFTLKQKYDEIKLSKEK